MTEATFEGWALLELMGHRQRPGYVTEVELGGAKMLRVDVPHGEYTVTEFYGGAAVYCLTPMDEEVVRDKANSLTNPMPIRPRSYRDPEQQSLIDGRDGASGLEEDYERY